MNVENKTLFIKDNLDIMRGIDSETELQGFLSGKQTLKNRVYVTIKKGKENKLYAS